MPLTNSPAPPRTLSPGSGDNTSIYHPSAALGTFSIHAALQISDHRPPCISTMYIPEGLCSLSIVSCTPSYHSYHHPSQHLPRVRTQTWLFSQATWPPCPASQVVATHTEQFQPVLGWAQSQNSSARHSIFYLHHSPSICRAKPKLALGCHGNSSYNHI